MNDFLLPEIYDSALEALEQALAAMTQAVAQQENLAPAWAAVQRHYQQQVKSWEGASAPRQAALLQSVQTEMRKQMRLLQTDLLFLQSARQAATRQQRYQQIGDRLRLLADYCQGLRQILSAATSDATPDATPDAALDTTS